MKEQSYVMVKPEFANNKNVIFEIAKRLEESNLKITKSGYIHYTPDAAKMHYEAHVGKDFYPHLEKYITSDVAFGMVVKGENAIATIRELVGSTKNPEAGTIRYDIPKQLGLELRITENVVHASDCVEAAEKEIEIFANLLEKAQINSL